MSTTSTASDALWAVTSRPRKKRIHRINCRYATQPYIWAGRRIERELFDALVENGSARWHDAGQCCSYNLDHALDAYNNSGSVHHVERAIARLEVAAASGETT